MKDLMKHNSKIIRELIGILLMLAIPFALTAIFLISMQQFPGQYGSNIQIMIMAFVAWAICCLGIFGGIYKEL